MQLQRKASAEPVEFLTQGTKLLPLLIFMYRIDLINVYSILIINTTDV